MDHGTISPRPGGNSNLEGLALKSLMESTPLLTETNYSIWKKKIEKLFKMCGILHLMNLPNPDESIPDKDETAAYLISKA